MPLCICVWVLELCVFVFAHAGVGCVCPHVWCLIDGQAYTNELVKWQALEKKMRAATSK